jgi:hypothetical protein
MTVSRFSFPQKVNGRIVLYGVAQLILGVISASWAWRLWQNADRGVPASFWGVLALTLFLLGGAQINLVGPWRRKRVVPQIALPYRLEPEFGEVFKVWPMFSLALTFGMPVFPMILFLLKVEGNLAELRLIWVGLTLAGAVVGGATFWLGLRKLYEQVNGTQTVVETSAEVLKPGESFSVFVQVASGRVAVSLIQVKLVCKETWFPRRNRAGKVAETKWLYEREVESVPHPGAGWQRSFSVTVPETAPLSTEPHQRRSITWGIEVRGERPNAPDFAEWFVFTVDDPEVRARLEAAWEAEDLSLDGG